jgi:hypothetical protein
MTEKYSVSVGVIFLNTITQKPTRSDFNNMPDTLDLFNKEKNQIVIVDMFSIL